MFFKKDAFKNFAKFTGKQLCQSIVLKTLQASVSACNFIKKETLAQVFSCEFCEIFKSTFFIEHLRWLLLNNVVWTDNVLLVFFLELFHLVYLLHKVPVMFSPCLHSQGKIQFNPQKIAIKGFSTDSVRV